MERLRVRCAVTRRYSLGLGAKRIRQRPLSPSDLVARRRGTQALTIFKMSDTKKNSRCPTPTLDCFSTELLPPPAPTSCNCHLLSGHAPCTPEPCRQQLVSDPQEPRWTKGYLEELENKGPFACRRKAANREWRSP